VNIAVVAAALPATLSALHRHSRQRLEEGGVNDAAFDARLIVEHFTGTNRTDAISDPEREIGAVTVAAVEAALRRRIAHEPVHRILGRREFYGLDLKLSPATLEPRPDTETLVDLCLPFLRERTAVRRNCRILDLGTGTGAVALALLSQIPGTTALGTDISAEALEMALSNADISGLKSRFEGVVSDWFEAVDGRFILIVSNPPYIRTRDIEALASEVRDHDPMKALDGGMDGLDAYRSIAAGAGGCLEQDGRVAVETGFDQRQDVIGIFEAEGFVLKGSAKDLGGNERALMFARH
jgi:release factor glutamine methyltransferase